MLHLHTVTHLLWISSRCELDVSVRSDGCSGSVCPVNSEDSLTGSVCLSRHTHHRQDRRFPFLSQRDWFTCWRWQSLWNRQREEQSQCLRLMTVLSDSLVHFWVFNKWNFFKLLYMHKQEYRCDSGLDQLSSGF